MPTKCPSCFHEIVNGALIDCPRCGHCVRPTSRKHFDRCFKRLYHRRINKRVTVAIGQLQAEGERAQHLTLLIDQTDPKRWISLRLSTFRKVIKFLAKHGFEKARRLTEVEKRRIDGDLRLRDRVALPAIAALEKVTKRKGK